MSSLNNRGDIWLFLFQKNPLYLAVSAQTVDLSAPGQQGALRNPSTYLNSSRFVKGNTIAILVSEPKAMKYMPDGEKRIAILRSLIEDRAVTISGLNGNIQAEFAETTEGQRWFQTPEFRAHYA